MRRATKAIIVEQRREERLATRLLGAARWEAGTPISVVIEDVSINGVQMRTSSKIAPGTSLRIGLPNGHAPYARVVWSRGNHVGCEFAAPLDESELAMLMPAISRDAE